MGRLRWQPVAAIAGLAAPPVVLAALVWPAGAEGGAGGGDPIELEIGEAADGQVLGNGVTTYELTAEVDGPVRIDVLGRGQDPTLTVVDAESGDELGFNDDTDGTDSRLVLDLEEGQVILAEVRSFDGSSIAFTIRARRAAEDDLDGEAGGPGTTIPADGAVEAFEEPIGDEPIEVDLPSGGSLRIYEQGREVCMDVQRPDGGYGSCGQSLADLAQPGGFGGSYDGRVSIMDIVTLVGPEVASAAAVAGDDDDPIELDVVELPGRVEQVVIGQLRFPGDVFARPGGSGYVVELRDADGVLIESFPA